MGADLERWLLTREMSVKDDGSFILDADGNRMQIIGSRVERDPNDPDRVLIHCQLQKMPDMGNVTFTLESEDSDEG